MIGNSNFVKAATALCILSINFNALAAKPMIILDESTLSLRAQPDDEEIRSLNSPHKVQLSFGTQIPLKPAFEISTNLEESLAQIHSFLIEYSHSWSSSFDFRGGLGVENQQLKSQIVSGGNRTVFNVNISTFPVAQLSAVYHLTKSKSFLWSIGNTLGFGKQNLSFDSTDTNSQPAGVKQWRVSNNLFLETQFLRNDNNHYFVRAGWSFRQLPGGDYTDGIESLVVQNSTQSFSLLAGFGFLL